MKTQDEWSAAKRRLDEVISEYESLQGMPGVNVNFALGIVLRPLLTRYNEGERTEDLYESMMNVE